MTTPTLEEARAENIANGIDTKHLIDWALKKKAECLLKHAKPGVFVKFGNSEYEVAGTERGMVKIYDEPPSQHTDLINPRNLTLAIMKQHDRATDI